MALHQKNPRQNVGKIKKTVEKEKKKNTLIERMERRLRMKRVLFVENLKPLLLRSVGNS